MIANKIELISTNILNQHKKLSGELSVMNKSLALSGGWHYILDWTWTISQMEIMDGKTVLDAGAGIGFLQWYLASRGAHVISVDRSDRTCVPFHLVSQFNVDGLTPADKPLNGSELLNIFNGKTNMAARVKNIVRGILGKLKYSNRAQTTGTVKLYKKDLGALTDIPDNSVDFVVSISALEHNETINNIKEIVGELYRVLKPGGKMIITLPAAHEADWFFEPAYSWCFTDATIKDIFEFPENTPSNYDQYENIFDGIKNSKDLKNNISWRYYFTRNSGLPRGKWNPQYIPVGVVKIK